MVARDGPGQGKARQTVETDLAALYINAAEVKLRVELKMKEIGQATGSVVAFPPGLKKISRILEKILFDFEVTRVLSGTLLRIERLVSSSTP